MNLHLNITEARQLRRLLDQADAYHLSELMDALEDYLDDPDDALDLHLAETDTEEVLEILEDSDEDVESLIDQLS